LLKSVIFAYFNKTFELSKKYHYHYNIYLVQFELKHDRNKFNSVVKFNSASFISALLAAWKTCIQ